MWTSEDQGDFWNIVKSSDIGSISFRLPKKAFVTRDCVCIEWSESKVSDLIDRLNDGSIEVTIGDNLNFCVATGMYIDTFNKIVCDKE